MFPSPLDHITLVPAQWISYKTGCFKLPAFSYNFSTVGLTVDSTNITVDSTATTVDDNNQVTNPLSWSGASVVIAQYNFTSTNNFVLISLPEKPLGVNFCLCIRYRVGEKVTRYKLWENVGEVLAIPLYDGQVILKNFVLEIWSVKDDNTAINTDNVILDTSITELQSVDEQDLDTTTNFEVALGVEFLNLLNQTEEVDTSFLYFWYSYELARVSVNDLGVLVVIPEYLTSVGANTTITTGSSTMFEDSTLVGYEFPKFGVGFLTQVDSVLVAKNPRNVILMKVLNLPGIQTQEVLFGNIVISLDSANNLIVTVNGHNFTYPGVTGFDWFYVDVTQTFTGSNLTNILIQVNGLDNNLAQSTLDVNEVAVAGVAFKASVSNSEVYMIADVFSFNSNPDSVSPYTSKMLQNYGYIALSMNFDSGGPWLTN